MRQRVLTELNEAMEAKEKRRATMLRLILTAIDDRVAAAKKNGKEGIADAEIMDMLRSMIEQREESAQSYDESGKIDLAEQEREEIEVILQLMPKQLDSEQVKVACQKVIDELGAAGLKDMGRAMNVLKEKYEGQMDFGRASCVVKDMLRCQQN